MAGEKLPTEPTKGAGTTLWIFTASNKPDMAEVVEKIRDETAWTRLAKIRELTPGELSAQSEDDTYLDDEDADWSQTTQGEKSAGETNFTLAWKPGEQGQQQLVEWFHDGTVLYYKTVYANGAIDLYRGWVSGLGKTVTAKEIMTRTAKITNTGRPPVLAEEDLADDGDGGDGGNGGNGGNGGDGGNGGGEPATITITTQPQSHSLEVGHQLSLSVIASVSDNSALEYQWKKDGESIPGATSLSYNNNNVDEDDAGNYTCVISSATAESVTSDPAIIDVV